MRVTRATKHDAGAGGREITAEELAQWRKTGVWPSDVGKSADYVELTPDEVRALGETGTWPARFG
jgi:hypothetical protein